MLLTLLTTGAELLIPLSAIVLSLGIPIVGIVFYYKHKSRIMDERKLMIEKGLTPPAMSKYLVESNTKSPLSKGIDMLAVSAGIISGYFVSQSWDTNTPISIICTILFFLGVANIAKSFLIKNETENYE